jgi:hypothetical protein
VSSRREYIRAVLASEAEMGEIVVTVLRDVDEGVEVGSIGCACGDCRPTATIYRDDPAYDRHDPKLAEGPCCCGRFFVVGRAAVDVEQHAHAMGEEINATRRRPHQYRFERRELSLPWGEPFQVIVADLIGRV